MAYLDKIYIHKGMCRKVFYFLAHGNMPNINVLSQIDQVKHFDK